MNKEIILFGNGNVALVAYHAFEHDHKIKIAGFTVDREYIGSEEFLGLPVVAFDEVTKKFPPEQFDMFVSLGFTKTNRLRADKYLQALKMGYGMPTLIHPKATIYPGVKTGYNCSIGANVVIQPGAVIGNNVVIRDNSFIGHGVRVSDHCYIGAGTVVAGGSNIGERCLLGINSTIRESVNIGTACIVGAGVTILSDIKDKEVYLSQQGIRHPFSSDEF